MRSVKPFLVILAAAFAVTACTKAPSAAETAAEETSLKAATTTWLNAYNAGDPDTIADLYVEDAVLMPPHAPVASGKAAIREFVAKDSAAAKAAGVKLVPGNATAGISGDTGWESGSYTVTDASGKVVDSGSYLSVSKKVNGKWLLYRDTYNSDQPLPTPPPPAPAADKK
jgi:uncharacterized protein (TIGR02246 family)